MLDQGGREVIEVEILPLSEILSSVAHVDLLDMDVQGAEADVIEGGTEVLNEKVRLMHVGTHDRGVEERIRSTMSRLGWAPIWDFPNRATVDTPFGEVSFVDGVSPGRTHVSAQGDRSASASFSPKAPS